MGRLFEKGEIRWRERGKGYFEEVGVVGGVEVDVGAGGVARLLRRVLVGE